MKTRCAVLITAMLSLAANMAFGGEAPSRRISEFEQGCVAGTDNCTYIAIHFESNLDAHVRTLTWVHVSTAEEVDLFNAHIGEVVRQVTSSKEAGSVSVQYYDATHGAWHDTDGFSGCRLCVSSGKVLAHDHAGLYRIEMSGNHHADSDDYLVFGDVVYAGQGMRMLVNVSVPDIVNKKYGSPVYVDYRVNGEHGSTYLTTGGIFIALDSAKVPGALPDYVTVSHMQSWAKVGERFVAREGALLGMAESSLHRNRANDSTRPIASAMRTLQSYHLRYIDTMHGSFPTVSPRQLITAGQGDCKAFATLADALLREQGIAVHPILLSARSYPPMSFSVPGTAWPDLHVILYLPDRDIFIDPSLVGAFGVDWKASAERYRGAIALDMSSGVFVVVH